MSSKLRIFFILVTCLLEKEKSDLDHSKELINGIVCADNNGPIEKRAEEDRTNRSYLTDR